MRLRAITLPSRRLRWLLAAALAPALVAGPALTTASAAAPRPSPSPGITGACAASCQVTLITGDRIRLSAPAPGHLTLDASQSSSAISVTGTANRSGLRDAYAIPVSAGQLVLSGLVDRGLFDVGWLAAHGDSGRSASLPVVVQYGGHHSASVLAHDAALLPGAAVTAISAPAGTAQVRVPARELAAFWRALTGQRPGPGPEPVRLARGIARVWPAGHPRPHATRPASATTHTVTETITATGKTQFGVLPGASLFGVSGAGAGTTYQPVDLVCDRQNAFGCLLFKITFQVPTGVYSATTQALDFQSDATSSGQAYFYLVNPQFSVTGNTGITFNQRDAREIKVSVPQGTSEFTFQNETYRWAPDGTASVTGLVGAAMPAVAPETNMWVIPTPTTATIGSFTFQDSFTLGQPPLTAALNVPKRMALHPSYAGYGNYDLTSRQQQFPRFKGTQTLKLVDAGLGTKQDFARVHARGALALITLRPDGGCKLATWQVTNARLAGAAGLLVDPRDPAQNYNSGICPVPTYPPGRFPISFRYASLPAAEAAALEKLVASGPGRVTLTDNGPAKYIYNVNFYQTGGIKAAFWKPAAGQFASVLTRVHSQPASVYDSYFAAYRPDDPGLKVIVGTNVGTDPASVREYYGPVAPDLVWGRLFTDWFPAEHSYQITSTLAGGNRTDDIQQMPLAPGAQAVDPAVLRFQPGKWDGSHGGALGTCALCRQGNYLYPTVSLISGANPLVATNAQFDTAIGPVLFLNPATTHLYRGSTEIPATTNAGLPAYPMPAASSGYRLVTAYNTTTSSWRFTSAEPVKNNATPGDACIGTLEGVDKNPCGANPLIFLRYNAGTGLNNAVTAPGTHQLGVTAYYQETTAPATITSLKLWISTDNGKTWQALTVHGSKGSYTASYMVPRLSQTSGAVSVKAQATDSAGDSVSQSILGAWNLTAG